MDTALITFMLQTSPATQSVHLIGSWDNFSKHYPMQRDVKRSRGQWRGCYAFEDIICDGDGGGSPKRNGGLKMGSTYYYYYELDNGTEHYDSTIPFTTSCPFLPGQPVNLLHVPTEVQPLRYRSASLSSMANVDIKTMNPADKFMAPRQPPPPPTLSRLNTSPVVSSNRSARSVSPNSEKSPWSRMFLGLRSQPTLQDVDNRGRSSSLRRNMSNGSIQSRSPSFNRRSDEKKTMRSPTRSRDVSPQSFKGIQSRSPSPQALRKVQSREPSPLRQQLIKESSFNCASLTIPDEIAEEAEDDMNFASDSSRISFDERGVITRLSPPPSLRTQPSRAHLSTDTSKPLPQLPEEPSSFLVPDPLRIRPEVGSEATLPRSHFSTSTISTTVSSPTGSCFDFSGTPSIADSNDDEDLAADVGSGDEFTHSPLLSQPLNHGFSGYSLPDGDYASEQTLRKESPLSPLNQTASRTTFGGVSNFSGDAAPVDEACMTALEQLLSEMGYLGDVINGK